MGFFNRIITSCTLLLCNQGEDGVGAWTHHVEWYI